MLTILKDRGEVVSTTTQSTVESKREVLGMGRHIAWIETEVSFANAIEDARKRSVSVKMLTVKEQTPERFANAFENLGVYVRYYDHGDIRVLIFDRRKAIIAIPSHATVGSPFFTREYVAVYTDDDNLITKLCERFDDMWEKGEKRGREASLKDKLRYFWQENRSELIVGTITTILGVLIGYIIYLL